jgi:hypothetical protein
MKSTTLKNTTLIGALLGVLTAGPATAANLRFQGTSGDWTNTVAVTGSYGWQAGGGGPGGLPGANDTARLNWGSMAGNTVTLSTVAPLISNFQFGVDESGYLIVNAGGVLTTKGGNSTVGNNNTACIGRMTVNTGGQVIVTNVLFVGNTTSGFVTNDGGNILVTSHLWVSAATNIVGAVTIKNGGVINIEGNIGLGTKDAVNATGGKGYMFVQDGGTLNLSNISPTNSIQPNSLMDISGSGKVIISGDRTAVMSYYTNVGRLTAYAGTGKVGIDYNNTNVGKTTLFAIVGYTPPTEDIWNPAANPSGTGKWSEDANWSSGYRPTELTKVIFNSVGAIPCTVTNNTAVAGYLDMGDIGPGGTLIITNGGSLTCGAGNPSLIGDYSNAVMVVENGGAVAFGDQLQIGHNWGADGTLIMNGGSVSVAGLFSLGYAGGTGIARIKGGTLSLSQWDYFNSIQNASVLDVTGTGQVVINGNQTASVQNYILNGQITNSVGTNVAVDYNNIHLGKTTIYPAGAYLAPEQVVWNPALNFPDTNGLWNVSSNWTGAMGPTNVTIVLFNVPDAIPCTVTNAAFAKVVRMGNSAASSGGVLIITNGGSLTTSSADDWSAVAYHSNALMIVEAGGSASFAYHLWIGFNPDADGTLIMKGGTVAVNGAFGLGFSGGKGTALIHGGTLNLAQWNDTQSIQGASVLDLGGTGTVLMTGNHLNSVSNYISSGQITADAGAGTVAYGYDSGANNTIVQVAPPRQPVAGVSASNGSVTISYQTTPGHFYHLESTAGLSPATWTRVAGSTTNAVGASVTFTFPTGSVQTFYRTVSP